MNKESLYAMALTRISNFNFQTARELYQEVGSATDIYEHRKHIADILPNCSPRLLQAILNWDEPLRRAEAEMEFAQRHQIQVLTPLDEAYPARLQECVDAPLVLYYRGQADLNCRHVLAIVGTRHCTTYGQDLIRHLLRDLKTLCPDVLVVSGLAYGVDVQAHTQALANQMPTVGVLAHGLDQLYPSAHRSVAASMVEQGGLLTEFMSQTNADKLNFVKRNRIVAGMSDATLLVESARKGGGLITTGIACSYARDVFAFPGPVGATYSEGCNKLIRNRGAELITCAADLVEAMGWDDCRALGSARNKGIERQLFPNLTDEEQRVVDFLQKRGDQPANTIAIQGNIPIHLTNTLLFQLEMKGVVKPLAGGLYHLLS